MLGTTEYAFFGLTVFVQVLGIASVACARLSERSSSRVFFQRVCYGSFVVIGLATMFAVAHEIDSWFSFATTLAVMSVAATVDLSSRKRFTTS